MKSRTKRQAKLKELMLIAGGGGAPVNKARKRRLARQALKRAFWKEERRQAKVDLAS